MDYTTILPLRFIGYCQHPISRRDAFFDKNIDAFIFIEIVSHLEIINSIDNPIRITDSKFSSVTILDGSFESITFRDCVFNGDFIIEGGDFKSILYFLNCEFRGNLIIRDGNFRKIIFENSTCYKNFKISGGIIERLVYSSANEKVIFKIEGRFTLIHSLKLNSVSGMTMFAKQCTVNNLLINGYYNTSSRIDFSDIKCNYVEIYNVNNDGKIYFSNFNNCLVDKLSPVLLEDVDMGNEPSEEELLLQKEINQQMNLINNVKLYNNFFFNSLRKELLYEKTRSSTFIFSLNEKKGALFCIVNCSLGVLELRDIPLEKMGVKALSSDLSSVRLINTRFPLKIESNNVLNEYYIFNDMYTSANKQNNFRDKIDYYRVSQQALLKSIVDEGRLRSLPSYISIIVSKLVSSHGSNWGQALLVTVAIGILFFGLFVISFDDIYIDLSNEGYNYFINKLLPYIPQFFNPLHKIDYIGDITSRTGAWTGLVDVVGRIFVSIGIFETVRSFRKFVRT